MAIIFFRSDHKLRGILNGLQERAGYMAFVYRCQEVFGEENDKDFQLEQTDNSILF